MPDGGGSGGNAGVGGIQGGGEGVPVRGDGCGGGGSGGGGGSDDGDGGDDGDHADEIALRCSSPCNTIAKMNSPNMPHPKRSTPTEHCAHAALHGPRRFRVVPTG